MRRALAAAGRIGAAHPRRARCGGSPGSWAAGRLRHRRSCATPRPTRPWHGVDRARGAAGPRLLVLLRRRQARPLDRAERAYTQQLWLIGAGYRLRLGALLAAGAVQLALPRLTSSPCVVVGTADRGRRRTRTTTRRRSGRCSSRFARLDRRPRPALHAPRRAAGRPRRSLCCWAPASRRSRGGGHGSGRRPHCAVACSPSSTSRRCARARCVGEQPPAARGHARLLAATRRPSRRPGRRHPGARDRRAPTSRRTGGATRSTRSRPG